MTRRALVAVALAGAFLPAGAAAGPTAPPLTTSQQVLAAIQRTWNGLRSYSVPLTMKGSVKVGFISLPFTMSGTEYYQAPDKQALRMRDVPKLAQQFANQVGSLGLPETWPKTYAIALKGRELHGKHLAYVLVGVPRASGNVKNVTLWVNAQSFAINDVEFAYQNGARLHLTLLHHNKNAYRLPAGAQIDAKFPGYGGSATIEYGTYATNVPIDPSVFKKQ